MNTAPPRLATLLDQTGAFDALDSAVAVIGTGGEVLYANAAFSHLRRALFPAVPRSATPEDWFLESDIGEALRACIDSGAAQSCQHTFRYDVNIPVKLTLRFRPLLEDNGDRAQAALLTIGEESIEFDRRHLARFQRLHADLTERVLQLSSEQVDKDELVRALLAETPFAVLIFDARRRLMRMNRYAEQLYRHSSRDLIGMRCEHFLDCYGRNEGCPVLDGGETIRNEELTGLRHGRPPVPLLRSAVLLTRNAEPVILEAVIDITERKQAEQELERYRRHLEVLVAERTAELESFSYSVSHDLRGPLRAIDGYSLVLSEEYQNCLDDQAHDYLQRVRKASQQMGRIIDSLLTLSRMGRSEMVRAPVDLGLIATEVIRRLQEEHAHRQVLVSVQSGMRVEADPNLMRVVLENLLGNAWKFTARREHAEIEFGEIDDVGQRTFFVRDNGAGFDMRYQGKLFKAFERLHDSSDFHGTGIGLASVARIIQRHDGQVWAEGVPDKGATFYFTLGRSYQAGGKGMIEKRER